MKIAFLVNEFPSVSETFVLKQITGLLDRGHNVDIFAQSAARQFPIHEDIERYNLLERTNYLTVPHNKWLRVIKGLQLVIKFITKHPLPILKSLNIFKYGIEALSLTLLYQVIPFFDKGPYDIIHCQFGTLGLRGLQIRQIAAVDAKLVTSFRGYDSSEHSYNRAGVYEELFRDGDLFFPVSESIRKWIVKQGCDEKKVVVHRSGLACENFKIVKKSSSRDEPTRVVTVARLVEKKGIQYALKAIARVVALGRPVNYVVVGDGELRGDLERLVKELRISSHVQILGWRTHDEVIRLLQGMDILLAPSVTASNGDAEGIPNVIKEAMALGLPIISTEHSGIPELVENGISGFLVKERDVDSLTTRLSYLIDHPELRPEMGRAGHACVQEHYDINKLNDQLVDQYDHLLSGVCKVPHSRSRVPIKTTSIGGINGNGTTI